MVRGAASSKQDPVERFAGMLDELSSGRYLALPLVHGRNGSADISSRIAD
ncbi:hypothetical protein J23TS9_12810 [Paenibacillus sp. J23TS9]|nr:hypothetical protein [Paenibacillus sp. J23TS9]GIP26151.1 hypothetical protein J23TS9_12810 [Paenibacillus sp. J23TS9]